jgi:sugar porter (SP) family MFS transporter
MFGSGAGPSVGFLAALFFVPESPRWLVKQGRVDDALHVLSRIGGEARAQAELAEIRETLAQEGGSVWDLFQPAMRVVLLIAVGLAVLQQVTGINVFLYYAPEIFKKISHAGSDVALLQTVVVGAVNMLFTFLAIGTVDRVGRKPLMLIGAAGMGLCLVAMGLAAYVGSTGAGVLVFVLGYIACFAMSVGPVTWVILSEIFPTKIRGRAMSLATFCLWTANFVVSQTFPMMDQNEWLVARFHQAFPFWIYALMCVIQFVFVWRLVPETKGQSLEQIERIWRH